MLPISIDLRHADAVVEALLRGAEANRTAACRRGSTDVVECLPESPQRLIATGDLHDNPLHLARVVAAAGMHAGRDPSEPPAHLTLHELIHPDKLTGGMDFSYRVLTRAAVLKAEFPEHVHTLLANHELAQATGGRILKDGVLSVEAFDDGVRAIFSNGDDADRVLGAVRNFVLSMPLALRMRVGDGRDVLCAHSLPSPSAMARFDLGVLERALDGADYVAREGSAHLMVWGRGQTPETLATLASRWGIGAFILGHEKAEHGCFVMHHDGGVPPGTSEMSLPAQSAAVVNSDHDRGVYLELVIPTGIRGGRTHVRVVPIAQS
jgi:hypothetical protein